MTMRGDEERRRASFRIGLLSLAITSVGWGLNWPAMKVLLRELPPLLARGTSGLAAALLLTVIAIAKGQSLKVPRRLLPRLVAASFFNIFAWMGFATLSMQWLPVSQAALLVYTMPVWATLLAWAIRGQRPSAWSMGGMVLCALGMWCLFGGSDLSFSATQAVGIAFALASAVLFALGTVAMRPINELGSFSLLAWQLALGSLPMIAIGAVFEPLHLQAVTMEGGLLWVYMTLVPMGLCYLTWFNALRHLPAATASMATLMTPVIGVLSASLFLSDPFTSRLATAMVLTGAGVWLSLSQKRSTPS